MKTVGLMPRRVDISRAAFRDHYENRHAPLALPLFPFKKYVRNHVVASDPDPVGFDCLSEFWVDDLEAVHRLMASEVGETMREDERRFTDQQKISPAVAEETHVAGPPRGLDPTANKEILLLSSAAGVSDADFCAAVTAWGKALAAGSDGQLTRVTFDALTPFDSTRFPPCAGILYGWVDGMGGMLYDAAPPDDIEIYGRLKTQSIETPL